MIHNNHPNHQHTSSTTTTTTTKTSTSDKNRSKSTRFVTRPLQRNQACSTCRSRKVRCDAHKPACSACRRSAAAHGEDPNLVVCLYDHTQEPDDPLDDTCSNLPITKSSSKVAALEQKIAELERLISQFNLDSQLPPSSISPELIQPSIPTDPSYSCPLPSPSEVVWSNWPNCLPPRRIITHLVELYFNSQSVAGQLMFFEPARLLANLHLSPNHPQFPFVGLLHAIMALAYRQSVSKDPDQAALNLLRISNIKRYWPIELSVHRYHADRAKSLIEQALYDGTHLFQLTQALNIYCFYAYETVQLVPAWVCSGLAVRFSTPLGLNQLEKSAEHLQGSKLKPKSLLPEPCSVVEKYTRAVTFWLAFQMDRFLSISAGRPHSISEADISSLLPAKPGTSQATIGTVNLHSNPLSLSHPHFFSNHPDDVDAFQLELKATVLLGRVSDWLIRAPEPVGFNLRKYWQMPDGPIPDLRSQGDFIQLDQDINALQISLAPKFHQTILEGEGTKVSSSKVMIVLIVNLSMILLHECFITKDQSDLSFQRCSRATSKIKCVGDLLFGAGYDSKLLHPFTNYCWAVAIRMMMRQLVQNEIRLIELATASMSYTKALSTCWIQQSPISNHPYETPEDGKNEELARLLKTEQAKVNQNLSDIESLLRFNTNNSQPPQPTQQPAENLHQYTRSQVLGGGHQNHPDGLIGSFSSGTDDFHRLDLLDSGNPISNLANSLHFNPHTFQFSNLTGLYESKLNYQTQHFNQSNLHSGYQSSTKTLPQQVNSQNDNQSNAEQHASSYSQVKLSLSRNHRQDQIKGLDQIYFDQMIKLFHIRFQAFRLPKSLSQIADS